MKSNFSRFLHYTLSHSDVREVFTSSLSLSDLIGESRSNQVANLSNLDYRVKPDNDSEGADYRVKFENDGLCTGRSMVEMLGVLAIIGVLSVGAIAGYSKAMFKYKLNKFSESFNSLINSAIQIGPDLSRSFSENEISTEIFYKLNLIPDGMTYKNNRIYDIFNNSISITYYLEPVYQNREYFIAWYMERVNNTVSQRSIEICRNAVTVAKENHENIDEVQIRAGNSDATHGFVNSGILRGDLSKYNGTKLRDVGVKEIDDFCSSCNSESRCSFFIFFKA